MSESRLKVLSAWSIDWFFSRLLSAEEAASFLLVTILNLSCNSLEESNEPNLSMNSAKSSYLYLNVGTAGILKSSFFTVKDSYE